MSQKTHEFELAGEKFQIVTRENIYALNKDGSRNILPEDFFINRFDHDPQAHDDFKKEGTAWDGTNYIKEHGLVPKENQTQEQGRVTEAASAVTEKLGELATNIKDRVAGGKESPDKPSGPEAQPPPNPEQASLEERISRLEQTVAALTDQMQKLVAENQRLTQENAQKDQTISELQARLRANSETKAQPAAGQEAKTETKPPQEKPKEEQPQKIEEFGGLHQNDKVVLEQDDGTTKPGYRVEGFEKDGDTTYATIKDDSGQIQKVDATKLKKESTAAEPTPATQTPPPIENRRKVEVRESLSSRIRRRLRGGEPPRQYYEDDNGYYYVDNDEMIYVPDNVVEERRNVGAIAVGSAVLGALIWELFEDRVFGHSATRDIRHTVNADFTQINNRITSLQDQMTAQHAHAHSHELKAIHGLHNEHVHAHKHDLNAIHGIHNQIARDHTQEMRGIDVIKERVTSHPLYFGARYPWDWAANKVGILKAGPWLHTLADRAAQHGHKVQWLLSGRREILKVDGTTNTQHVLNVLNQYR